MTYSSDRRQERTSCIIVGGGITGLITATILQRRGISVTVLDKGKGIGGRMATRRVRHEDSIEGVFDYGTQYFSVKNPQFQTWVDDWLKCGVIKEWCQGFGQADGKPRYCGVNGTRGIAKYLAQDLDVQTDTKVVKINYNGYWIVHTEESQQYEAEMLLLTMPVPQSLDLLDASLVVLPLDVRFALENITYNPCIAVLALLEQPSNIPAPGGIALEDSYLVWLADNCQKGISPNGYAVTLHGSPSFSEDYWDSDDAEIAYRLLTTAADYLAAPVIKYQVHRWRYSQPKTFHTEPYLALSEIPLIMAGDGFVAPKIEGAVLSGIATGELIGKRFKGK
ncbi:MAG: FAD-dependent oxidoreductase [Cyanobacteria bacterium J06631_2]